MTKRALLLVNRQARQGEKKFPQVVDILNELGFELLALPVKDSSQMPLMVRKHAKDVDLVIVGGGDGTLNAVVDSLVEMKLPLGILPLGTANDLARTLGIPNSIEEACQTIARGNIKHIDLGWVNGKHFFNVASLGLSVKITENLSHGFKRRWGVFAYALTAIKIIGQNRPFRAEIRIRGQSFRLKTIQIAIGNGRYYGGGMAVNENATIDDRMLDAYSLELKHWWQIFPLLRTLRTGRHHQLDCVKTFKAEEIELTTRKPHTINTDGELTTSTPATFRVVPRALGVLTPISE